jgi:uncharacterized protein (DUF169 family)
MKTREIGNSLHELLELTMEPVAVTFRDQPPAGIDRVNPQAPAGCSYWKLAAEGKLFYTAAEDHFNCPIGAYTHSAEMPAVTQTQLEGMIQKIVGIQYLRPDEVQGIPRREQPLRFVVYAPLSKDTGMPDVVLIRGNAQQAMLVLEAAQSRSLVSELPVMGRPACSVVAACLNSGRVATSLGCIGNRVYTGLADGELYVAIPGEKLTETVEALRTIVRANRELKEYYLSRANSN